MTSDGSESSAETGHQPAAGEAFDKTPRRTTDDTASELSGQGPYEIIEYDLHDKETSGIDIFSDMDTLHIQDDSPAAEALRANANVKVSSVGKAARAVHMQAVRKIVKRATGATKSGVTRGKPPRLPPTVHEGGITDQQAAQLDRIDEIEQEDDEHHDYHPAVTHESDFPPGVVAGTVEAGKEVLNHVDTHDLLKLLRWRRKRKGDDVKAQKSYVKGKVIDGQHELYTLSIAVMIGVRTSISRTNNELNSGPGHRWVKPLDFRATEKYEFRPKGGSLTPPHMLAHTFKFKDYSPVVFAYLRRMSGVNEFDFLLSVCGNANFIEFISNAKSGQFFFYSSDGRYMIKTMTNAESKFLRRVLPDYFRHLTENPNTLITRFLGMYRVKLYHLRRNVKFVIMNSVYYTDKFLQAFYDLKGSSLGRDAKPGDAVKKDNDLRAGLPGDAIALLPKQRKAMRAQIVSDCNFLERIGAMDYSMLVGVHHIPAFEAISRSGSIIGNIGFRGARPRTNSSSQSEAEAESELSDHDIQHANRKFATERLHERTKDPLAGAQRETKSDGHQRLNEAIGAFFYDNGLEDDDSSYLEGAECRPSSEERVFDLETERKKQATIEKLYWPFHRFFDIHGHRRVQPAICARCSNKPCTCNNDEKLLAGYKIPRFVPPISDRKDGGLEMDTTGQRMPMKFLGQEYEGKIFFMGMIDVLQEYNSRKMVESTFRSITSIRNSPSCVPPIDYGERFIKFFDEYTQPLPPTLDNEDEAKDPPK